MKVAVKGVGLLIIVSLITYSTYLSLFTFFNRQIVENLEKNDICDISVHETVPRYCNMKGPAQFSKVNSFFIFIFFFNHSITR